MGRRWHSPPGVNFYGTFILRPEMPVAEAALLSLVAGVAVAETMEMVAPRIVALKWPNDVWLGGRKAGGMIAEAVTDSRHRLACVLLGIGLNLNLAPEHIPARIAGSRDLGDGGDGPAVRPGGSRRRAFFPT